VTSRAHLAEQKRRSRLRADNKNEATTRKAQQKDSPVSPREHNGQRVGKGRDPADPARYNTAARCGRSACGTAGRTIGRVTQLPKLFLL